MKIAVVDKAPSKARYDEFDFEFDLLHLTDEKTGKKKRLLKADVSLTEQNLEDYDLVILVGAEPSKHLGKITQVTKYAGHLVNEKYIPMINPIMAKFKPEIEPVLDDALKRIKNYISGNTSVSSGEYYGITCAEQTKKYLRKVLHDSSIKHVSIDTETTALYPKDGYVLGISMSHKSNFGVYITSDIIDEEIEELFQAIFHKKLVVFHNAKFDIKMLEFHFGFKFPSWACTMIMHYILNENEPHDLKYNAMKYTDMGDYDHELDTWKKEYCRKNKVLVGQFTYDLIPFDIMWPYAAKDADATIRLYNLFMPFFERSKGFGKLLEEFLLPANRFLIDIETAGIPFSRNRLIEVRKELDEQLTELKENLYQYKEIHDVEKALKVVFNPNSTVHLGNLLFKQRGLPVLQKTATGAASTKAEVLEELAKQDEIASYILKIRKLQKLKSTYIDKIILNLDNDSRLRTNFNLTVATSGRLSSSGKLNAQQMPRDDKRVKSCISMKDIDPDYVIWSQDLQTAEMYYAAVLSSDENLMDVFRKGGDFHSTIAHTVFNLPCSLEDVPIKYKHMRQAAKAISFGILYGAGPGKIAAQAGISFIEAKEVIDQYFNKFYKLKAWLEKTQAQISSDGFIYSVFNRKRRVPNVFSISEEERGHAIRSALNFTVQSVASDINLMAAIELHNWFNSDYTKGGIFALVHDSILGTCHKDDISLIQEKAKYYTQKNRNGIIIPGCPIGVDFEYGESYAF